MQSVGRRIFSSALTVGSLNGIVMIGAVVRDLAFAHRFGTGEIVDGFLMGLLVPTIAVQIIAVSLGVALIPEIIRARGEADPEATVRISASGLFVGLVSLGIVGMALLILRGPITSLLNAGFDARRAEVTTFFYIGLLPCIVIQGWSILAGCLLNAAQRFAVVAVSPALRALAVCIAIFASSETNAAPAILIAYLSGALAEAVWITLAATRAGVLPQPRWWAMSSSFRRIIGEFGMVVLGTGILSGATLADQYFASLAGSGGVATYAYGTKIISVLIGAGAVPLAIAVLPHFSEQVQARKWKELRLVLVQWSGLVVVVSVPIVAAVCVYSAELVQLLFQRGAFSADDTQRVAVVQRYLALQIPFYFCGTLYVRALVSLQRNWLVALIACLNATVNVGGSLFLMETFGVAGIALAATCGYIFAVIFAGYILFQSLRNSVRMEAESALQGRVK